MTSMCSKSQTNQKLSNRHPLNVNLPICFRSSSSWTNERFVQSWNASSPIFSTEDGAQRLSRNEQPWNVINNDKVTLWYLLIFLWVAICQSPNPIEFHWIWFGWRYYPIEFHCFQWTAISKFSSCKKFKSLSNWIQLTNTGTINCVFSWTGAKLWR